MWRGGGGGGGGGAPVAEGACTCAACGRGFHAACVDARGPASAKWRCYECFSGAPAGSKRARGGAE